VDFITKAILRHNSLCETEISKKMREMVSRSLPKEVLDRENNSISRYLSPRENEYIESVVNNVNEMVSVDDMLYTGHDDWKWFGKTIQERMKKLCKVSILGKVFFSKSLFFSNLETIFKQNHRSLLFMFYYLDNNKIKMETLSVEGKSKWERLSDNQLRLFRKRHEKSVIGYLYVNSEDIRYTASRNLGKNPSLDELKRSPYEQSQGSVYC